MPNINTILLFALEKLLAFLQEEVHLRRTGEPLPGGSRTRPLNIKLPARKTRAKGAGAPARRMNPAVPLLVAAGVVLVGAWLWRSRQQSSEE